MVPRLTVVAVALSGVGTIAAGCAATGSNGQINGPEYDVEAGTGTDANAVSDGAKPTQTDAAVAKGSDASSVEDGGSELSPPEDASGGRDAALGDAGGCTSTTAILGGNDFSLFGAVATGTGAFATQTIAGSVGAAPALVAFGGGFEGLLAEAVDAGGGDALYSVGFTAGSWSAPSALGGAAAAVDAPAVAAVGTTLQAVYLNAQHLYFHAAYASSWDTGADPVRPPNDAGGTAFGPGRAAAAGTATELVIAYEGSNLLPYAQTWTSAAGWDDGVALGTTTLAPSTPMAIAAIDGGTNDLIAVYIDGEGSASANNLHLFFTLRSASTKAWSAPAIVNVNAYTSGAPSLTAMSGGRALVGWQGQSGGVYESVFSAGAWSSPAEIATATTSAAPSLAQGVCGDDAVAAYVSSGSVYTAHFVVGAWDTPVALAGSAGATAVTIATSP